MSTASSLVLAAEENLRELPMPAWLYGAIALALFFVLLALVWAFRGTAQKWSGQTLNHHAPHERSTGHGGH